MCQNNNENEKEISTSLSNMDGSWKHIEKEKERQAKRIHTAWLHSYKVQKLVKLIYDVRSQARSSIGERATGVLVMLFPDWVCSTGKSSSSCMLMISVPFYVYVISQ